MNAMTIRPIRLTVLLTHPIQYYAPWFRHIADAADDIELTVLYASQPNAAQQATGYNTAFEWDVPLLDGYTSVFARHHSDDARFGTGDFRGIDVAEIGDAIARTRPDVVLIPGWHSITYVRALRWCRRNRIPTIWRGDTHRLTRRSPVWYARTRALLHMFDYHLSVGQNTNDYLRAFGIRGTRIFSSPHHVDNARFAMPSERRAAVRAAVRERLGIERDAFVVASVGMIAEHKRPFDIVDAAARLGSGVTVLFVGEGVARASSEERARAAGVPLVCTGFVNQRDIPEMYAASDVVVVAGTDSWGLVMNEALAVGVPVVGSDRTGATRDLAVPGVTGERFAFADIDDLARALSTIRDGARAGRYGSAACHEHIRHYSIETATTGLRSACDAAVRRDVPRVLMIGGGLFVATGMERTTFEIVRMLRGVHARVHVSLNNWAAALWPGGPHLVLRMTQESGSSWTLTRYRTRLNRSLNPIRQLAVLGDVVVTSFSVLRDARNLRATHVFVPEFVSALRILPALAWLRLRGRSVVLKLPTAVPQGRFYRRVWRMLIDPVISRYVAQSAFTEQSLLDHGISADKVARISNTLPTRTPTMTADRITDDNVARGDQRVRIVFIGQVSHGKGVDLLLDAVGECVAGGMDAELVIVGDMTGWAIPEVTAYRGLVKERASRPDLRGRVHFTGFREDVHSILLGADMLCCPSRPELREAFGLVVIEAKNAGVPSVVFPTGAPPEHIEHGVDGWICDDFTASALADGIRGIHALQQRGARMGEAARASLTRYSYDDAAAAWRQIFRMKQEK
jgi:glycosyltransferase involved in cell wall biosynthesis